MSKTEEIQYISGSFLVKADAAFINGAGLQPGEDQTVSVPKTMWKNGQKIPYVSSQAWKHLWRQTLIEETKWPASNLRAIGWNEKGNTSKIAGMLDPINYVEDDVFGYMYALSDDKKAKEKLLPKEPTEEQKTLIDSLPDVQLIRPSTVLASLLYAVQTDNTISTDNAFVHLKDSGTPLPYSTKFYNADLQAIFGLDWSRIGVYDNLSAMELDPKKAEIELKKGTIIKLEAGKGEKNKYIKKDIGLYRKEVVTNLLMALANLRGGSKATQFGVDMAPKVLIVAGLDCKNPFLNNLFSVEKGQIEIHMELLKELIKDFGDRIKTKLYIGLRSGYLANEVEIKSLNKTKIENTEIIVDTPPKIAKLLGDEL